jgi:hypothetical protein
VVEFVCYAHKNREARNKPIRVLLNTIYYNASIWKYEQVRWETAVLYAKKTDDYWIRDCLMRVEMERSVKKFGGGSFLK